MIVARGAPRLDKDLVSQPVVKAWLQQVIAGVYQDIEAPRVVFTSVSRVWATVTRFDRGPSLRQPRSEVVCVVSSGERVLDLDPGIGEVAPIPRGNREAVNEGGGGD